MHILSRRVGGTLVASCLAWAAALADDTSRTIDPTTTTIAHRFVPALFGVGPESLRDRLTCPEPKVPGGQVLLSCKVRLDAEGQVGAGDSFCTGPRGTPVRYRQHMERILGASTFTAARVDEVPVPVQFFLVAYFRDEDGDCAASVVLNGGERDPEMGLNYIGPQEIVSDGGWNRRVKFREHGVRHRAYSRSGVLARVSVVVSEQGVAGGGRVERHDTLFFDSAEMVKALAGSRFIPGFHRGHPRAMRYYDNLYLVGLRDSYFLED